jgi:hypothetical protein
MHASSEDGSTRTNQYISNKNAAAQERLVESKSMVDATTGIQSG